jgi:membrane protein involved in colicin uptake
MTTEFEYSTFHREDLIYHFSPLSAEQVEEKKALLAKEKAEAAKAKAEADAKAKAEEAANAKEDTDSKENSN